MQKETSPFRRAWLISRETSHASMKEKESIDVCVDHHIESISFLILLGWLFIPIDASPRSNSQPAVLKCHQFDYLYLWSHWWIMFEFKNTLVARLSPTQPSLAMRCVDDENRNLPSPQLPQTKEKGKRTGLGIEWQELLHWSSSYFFVNFNLYFDLYNTREWRYWAE